MPKKRIPFTYIIIYAYLIYILIKLGVTIRCYSDTHALTHTRPHAHTHTHTHTHTDTPTRSPSDNWAERITIFFNFEVNKINKRYLNNYNY